MVTIIQGPATELFGIKDTIRRVGITSMKKPSPDAKQLFQLDVTKPLSEFIVAVCEEWNLHDKDPDHYSLAWDDPKRSSADGMFVSDINISNIKDGNLLRLDDSLSEIIKSLKLKFIKDDYDTGLDGLTRFSTDILFATEFVNLDGFLILNKVFAGFRHLNSITLSKLLRAYSDVLVSVNDPDKDVPTEIVTQLIQIVTDAKPTIGKPDELKARQEVIVYALSILEKLSQNRKSHLQTIASTQCEKLLTHLESEHLDSKAATVSLLLAITECLPNDNARSFVEQWLVKSPITRHRVHELAMSEDISESVKSKFYQLQQLILNLMYGNMLRPANASATLETNEQITRMVSVIWTGGLEAIGQQQRHHQVTQSYTEQFRHMGFKNIECPAKDFESHDQGELVLYLLSYITTNSIDTCQKILFDRSQRTNVTQDHDVPFMRTVFELCTLLVDLLYIGESALEDCTKVYPFLFSSPDPIGELLSLSMSLISRTWREMKASVADFSKVTNVVREQLSRCLDSPSAVISFDTFNQELRILNYQSIAQQWQKERKSKEDRECQAKPIRALREKLRPDILELVKQQRMNFVKEGTIFRKPKEKQAKSTKERPCWFWQLTPNLKSLLYANCHELEKPSMENCEKLAVSDIAELKVGRDCPGIKEKDKKRAGDQFLCFSLITINGTDFHFSCKSPSDLDHWCDAVNCLLKQPMCSGQFEKDLNLLLDMEVKLRLLELEGVEIPEEAPPIPPLPQTLPVELTG